GPPYPPSGAALGGTPTIPVDVPITSVFLLLFILGAGMHMGIFQFNKKKAHKFLMTLLVFGFCMCRIVTMALRISWATEPRNIKLGIAAMIFVQAGTVLLFVVNMIFAQRIIRAQHPTVGWSKAFDVFCRLIIVVIVLTLIALITVTVLSFYTLDTYTRHVAHVVQVYGSTYYAAIAALPIPMVILGLVVPRRIRTEKFGKGRFRTKIGVLLASSILLSIGAIWRCVTTWLDPTLADDPWYMGKAPFYTCNFTVEFLVVLLFAAVRVDRRFHVPNGAKGRGSYHTLPGANGEFPKNMDWKQHELARKPSVLRIFSEEELFDD
ncbi:hypothetical protein K402DRAFT_305959, partial [Aulographum hederae CBS 113979]